MRDSSTYTGRPNFRKQARREASSGTSYVARRRTADDSLYPSDWPEISAAVRKRDGYRCRVDRLLPNVRCDAVFPPPFHHYLHVHHIVELSRGGSNDGRNLLCVCIEHHNLLHRRQVAKPASDRAKRAARNWRV